MALAAPELLPKVRGLYAENAPLKEVLWFRVGGPAEIIFRPADLDDLCVFMAERPQEIPLTVLGVGSNLLVRDGGIEGVVIRLPASFGQVKQIAPTRIRAGAAALDCTRPPPARSSDSWPGTRARTGPRTSAWKDAEASTVPADGPAKSVEAQSPQGGLATH